MAEIDLKVVEQVVADIEKDCSEDNCTRLVELYYPVIFDVIKGKSTNAGTDLTNNINNLFFGNLIDYCIRGGISPVAFHQCYSNNTFDKYERWSNIEDDYEDDTGSYDVTPQQFLLGYLYTFESALLEIGGTFDNLTIVSALSDRKFSKATLNSPKYSDNVAENVKSLNTMLGVKEPLDENKDNSAEKEEQLDKGRARCEQYSKTIDNTIDKLWKIAEYYAINEPLGVFGFENDKPVLYTYDNGFTTVKHIAKVDSGFMNVFITNLPTVVTDTKDGLGLEPTDMDSMLGSNSDRAYSCMFAVSLLYHKKLCFNETEGYFLSDIAYKKYQENLTATVNTIFARVLESADDLFDENNKARNPNTAMSFVKSLCNRLTSFFAVEDYKGYSLRVSTRVGVFSDKNQYKVVPNRIVWCQHNGRALLDTTSEPNIINSTYNSLVYSALITTDTEKLYGETFFAYKMYRKRLAVQKYPSLESLVLGQTNNGTECTVDFAGNTQKVMNISAGPRQGKGVLTLNLLAGLLATGATICYCDAKPDMASMLWDIERTLRAESGVNDESGNILAIDCQYTCDQAVRKVEIGGTIPQELCSIKELEGDIASLKANMGVLAQAKLIQLMIVLSQEDIQPEREKGTGAIINTSHRLKVSGWGKEPLVLIIDEMLNMNTVLATLQNTIDEQLSSKAIKEKVEGKERQQEVLNIIANTAKKYKIFIDTIAGEIKNVLNAALPKTNFIKIIGLSQNFGTSKAKGATSAKPLYSQLLAMSSIRIYGSGGATDGQFGYCTDNKGCKEIVETTDDDDEEVTDSSKAVQARKFVLYQGTAQMSKDSRTTPFKPYIVLNENDIPDGSLTDEDVTAIIDKPDIMLGDKSCVTNFIKRTAKQNRGYVVREELTSKGDDNLYHRNDAVGFLGLIRMLLPKEDSAQILQRFSRGYQILWSLVKQCGIAEAHHYANLEQYLFDCSPDSLYVTTVIHDAIKNEQKVAKGGSSYGNNNSSEGEGGNRKPINTDGMFPPDESESGNDNKNGGNSEQQPKPNPQPSFEDEEDPPFEFEEDEKSGNKNGGNNEPQPKPQPFNPNPQPQPIPKPSENGKGSNNQNGNGGSQGKTETPYNSFGKGYAVYNDIFVGGESDNIFAKTYNQRDTISDLLSLREASTILLDNIKRVVGSLDRVHTLEFDENGVMIINNIIFAPKISQAYASTLPMDIRLKVESGCWSELFNFKDLYRFKNLGSLRIDNWDIAEIKLRNELGFVKKEWLTIKRKLRKKIPLQQLVIMGVTIDEQNAEKVKEVSNRHSFIDTCKNGFKKAGGKASSFVHSSHAQNVWNSKPAKMVRKAFGWGLGTQVLLWGVSAFGMVGLIGGAIGVASVLSKKNK